MSELNTLLANLSGKTRRETLDGKSYLVAPVTLIVGNTILNGSRGPLLYPADECKKSAKLWNGVPLVVYHPTENGKPVSAKSAGVLERSGVGVLRNCEYAEGKLRGEGWFDLDRVKNVDERVYDALTNGQKMEVSTGLGTLNEEVPPGTTWQGQQYVAIARNYAPDHLAILPDQTGACSLDHGCGLMVNKGQDDSPQEEVAGWLRSVNNYLNGHGVQLDEAKLLEAVKFPSTSRQTENEEGAMRVSLTEDQVKDQIADALQEVVNDLKGSCSCQTQNCSPEGECEECKKKRLAREKRSKEQTSNEVSLEEFAEVNGLPVMDSLVSNQLSHDDLRSRLTTLVQERFGSSPLGIAGVTSVPSTVGIWVVDVYDKDFVYQNGPKLYRLGYTADLRNETVKLSENEPQVVERKTSYQKKIQNLLDEVANAFSPQARRAAELKRELLAKRKQKASGRSSAGAKVATPSKPAGPAKKAGPGELPDTPQKRTPSRREQSEGYKTKAAAYAQAAKSEKDPAKKERLERASKAWEAVSKKASEEADQLENSAGLLTRVGKILNS